MASTILSGGGTTGLTGAMPNARRLVTAANGTKWTFTTTGAELAQFWFSTDDGATWSLATEGDEVASNGIAAPSGALFIDDDGFLNFAINGNPVVTYWRGTPNAANTGWTWAQVTTAGQGGGGVEMDIVTHRNPAGAGWFTHIASSEIVASGTPGASFAMVNVTTVTLNSGGTVTSSTGPIRVLILPNGTDNVGRAYPSIDFRHTGNGRTLAGNPDLFLTVRRHDPDTTSGSVGMFKMVYSGGSWSPQSYRSFGTTLAPSGTGQLHVGFFDGTRHVSVFAPTTTTIQLWERDASDTVSTQRATLTPGIGTLENLAATYDYDGNVYVGASGATDQDPRWWKWTRSGNSWSSATVMESTVTTRNLTMSARRGYTDSRGGSIDFVYLTGSDPYNARFHQAVALNVAPSLATWVTTSGAADVASALTLTWNFNDYNQGDTQSARSLRRTVGGVVRYLQSDGTTWNVAEQKVTSSTTAVTLGSGWGADGDANHSYAVKTWDASDLASAGYSSELVITPSVKVNPTVVFESSSVGANTWPSALLTIGWTVAAQTAYQARILSSGGAQLTTTGKIASTAARSVTLPYELTNLVSYVVEVTTWNTEDLASTPATLTFSTLFSLPPAATGVASTVSDEGRVHLSWSSPDPVGDEPSVSHVDIFSRVSSTSPRPDELRGTSGVRIAHNQTPNSTMDDYGVASDVEYEYRFVQFGVNGTYVSTEWSVHVADPDQDEVNEYYGNRLTTDEALGPVASSLAESRYTAGTNTTIDFVSARHSLELTRTSTTGDAEATLVTRPAIERDKPYEVTADFSAIDDPRDWEIVVKVFDASGALTQMLTSQPITEPAAEGVVPDTFRLSWSMNDWSTTLPLEASTVIIGPVEARLTRLSGETTIESIVWSTRETSADPWVTYRTEDPAISPWNLVANATPFDFGADGPKGLRAEVTLEDGSVVTIISNFTVRTIRAKGDVGRPDAEATAVADHLFVCEYWDDWYEVLKMENAAVMFRPGRNPASTPAINNASSVTDGAGGRKLRINMPISPHTENATPTVSAPHTPYTGHGIVARNRFLSMGLDPLFEGYMRYRIWLPYNFTVPDVIKLLSPMSVPAGENLYSRMTGAGGEFPSSWWFGVNLNGPSVRVLEEGWQSQNYTGDSNLDHIRIVSFANVNLAYGSTTQPAEYKAIANTVPNLSNPRSPTGSTVFLKRASTPTSTDGWNDIEMYVKMETTQGSTNGQFKLWVTNEDYDDLLCLTMNQIRFAQNRVPWNGLMHDTFSGGPRSQWRNTSLEYDHLVISDTKIGPV